MEQTFVDRLREHAGADRRLFGAALWMFVETSTALLRENLVQREPILRIALVTLFLLLVPLLAMQFTDEVVWERADFAVAGVLLFGAGLTYEWIARKGGTAAYRAAIGVAVATALVLIWMNLAVGLIGSEDNPANLMYGGVLAVGLVGAILARLRPRGMARALFATAFAQMLVGAIAMIAGLGFTWILNGFFVALWVGSALLFRRGAHATPATPA